MQKEYTLEQLAKLTQSQLVGNPHHVICGIADLESATEREASFLNNPRYEQAMRTSSAGVVFIDLKTHPVDGRNFLICENPTTAFQFLVDAFYGSDHSFTGFTDIHSTAVIHPSAQLGKHLTIGPHVVIDKDVQIGDNTTILAGSYIGPGTQIGTDCLFHPHVTVRERCVIGNRVILQPGVVIGSCGFGYSTDKTGRHSKLNQVGNVIIEDDVEIGSNTTIDRSRFKSTRIGQGTKIDNLVMIAHGVIVGKHSLLVAQTGVAGSTEIGNHVILAGQTAIAGHIKIADQTIVTGKSGVSKSITTPGEKWGGIPVMPLSEYNRQSVYLRNIKSYVEQIKELQAKVKALESKQD